MNERAVRRSEEFGGRWAVAWTRPRTIFRMRRDRRGSLTIEMQRYDQDGVTVIVTDRAQARVTVRTRVMVMVIVTVMVKVTVRVRVRIRVWICIWIPHLLFWGGII